MGEQPCMGSLHPLGLQFASKYSRNSATPSTTRPCHTPYFSGPHNGMRLTEVAGVDAGVGVGAGRTAAAAAAAGAGSGPCTASEYCCPAASALAA